MSVTRDFDAMLADKAGIRPTFKVAGQEFTLRSRLPYATWNRLLAEMRDDELDEMERSRRFFRHTLVKADRQRFLDLLDIGQDEEPDGDDEELDEDAIGLDQLGPITDWVLEHFTGKPQSNTVSSSPGSNGTGPAPNIVSLSSKKAANG